MDFLAGLPPFQGSSSANAAGGAIDFGSVDFGPSAAQQATNPNTLLLLAGAGLLALVIIRRGV